MVGARRVSSCACGELWYCEGQKVRSGDVLLIFVLTSYHMIRVVIVALWCGTFLVAGGAFLPGRGRTDTERDIAKGTGTTKENKAEL